jgi:hypothetical protein
MIKVQFLRTQLLLYFLIVGAAQVVYLILQSTCFVTSLVV